MLKVDFHTHASEDPRDRDIPYDSRELIDRATALGYQALALTLHDVQLERIDLQEYARSRGLVLIPGVERTIEGKHVLLIGFPGHAVHVDTFEQLRALKQRTAGLVIAPHPFFPALSCLGRLMDRHADLFDAVEYSGFYTATLNFNRRAVAWARRHGKPLAGNTDTHRLWQLGPTFSLVDAPPEVGAICAAVRAGRIEVRSEPLSLPRVARVGLSLVAAEARAGLEAVLARRGRVGRTEDAGAPAPERKPDPLLRS